MKVKNLLKILGIGLLGYAPLKAQTVNLEFIVQDQSGTALNNSWVGVYGWATDFLETKNTGDGNVVNFDVPEKNLFYSFAYNQGYDITDTTLIVTQADRQIELKLNKVQEGKWYSYYLNDGNLSGSFISFDEDVYYEGGNPFNYEIEITNISDDIITITNYDLLTYVSDSLGNFVPCPTCIDSLGNPIEPFFDDAGNLIGAWKRQLPDFELSYELNFKPRKGWLGVSVKGDTIKYSVGGVSGYLNDQYFDITEDEFVSETRITRNFTPHFINGTFHFNASLDYLINGNENKNNISIISQPFYVENNAPLISQHQPKELELNKNIDDLINFYMIAEDSDGDLISYKFLKNDDLVSNTNEYIWAVDKKGLTTIEGIAYNTLSDTVKWIVNVPDRKPEIVEYFPQDLQLTRNINDTINFEINAEDSDGDLISYKFLKSDSVLTDTNTYNWVIKRRGSTIIEGIAYNDLSDTVRWVIDVENRKPVAKDTSLSILEEAVLSIDKSELASDPDGDDLYFTVLDKENIDTEFINSSLVVSGLENYFGPAFVKYEVTDGSSRDTGNVFLDIRNVVDMPIVIAKDTNGVVGDTIPLISESYHPDSPLNEIVSGIWNYLSGPLDFSIINPDSNKAYLVPKQNGIYEFTRTVIDSLMQESKDNSTITVSLLGLEDRVIPRNYLLGQNYPNPFNSSTTIKYTLPERGHVELNVYNVLGREVRRLVDEVQGLGEYEVDFSSDRLPSGIYIYMLRTKDGDFTDTKKMLKLK